jgi:hypothetical protein
MLLNDQSGLVLGDSTVFSWAGCHSSLGLGEPAVRCGEEWPEQGRPSNSSPATLLLLSPVVRRLGGEEGQALGGEGGGRRMQEWLRLPGELATRSSTPSSSSPMAYSP